MHVYGGPRLHNSMNISESFHNKKINIMHLFDLLNNCFIDSSEFLVFMVDFKTPNYCLRKSILFNVPFSNSTYIVQQHFSQEIFH